jgi:hypothetical protein
MANTLSGVTAFMRAVINGRPWMKDPYAIRKAWDEDAYRLSEHGHGKKLCIGIMWHNGSVLPTPPITRGLRIVKEAMLAAGHEGARGNADTRQVSSDHAQSSTGSRSRSKKYRMPLSVTRRYS